MIRTLLCVLVIVLASCSGSKMAMTTEEMNGLEELVRNGDFTFEARLAFPRLTNSMVAISNAGLLMPNSNAGRIDLFGNTNYITFKNDSISTFLPYFGERQIVSGYGTNNNNGIVFDGEAQDLQIEPDKRNTSLRVEFTGVQDMESYRVIMNIFPNKKSNVVVTSSHRFSIGYSGNIKLNSESKETAETVFN